MLTKTRNQKNKHPSNNLLKIQLLGKTNQFIRQMVVEISGHYQKTKPSKPPYLSKGYFLVSA